MVIRIVKNARIYRIFEQILHTLCPDKIALLRTLETLNKKLNGFTLSDIFNETR